MKQLFLAALLAFSFNVSAAYVYTTGDTFTKTTDEGVVEQEWLRLSVTDGISMTDALTNNPGYRSASEAEVADLMDFFFPAGPTNASAYGSYGSALYNQVVSFEQVVGFSDIVFTSQYGRAYYAQGHFIAEDGTSQMSGTYRFCCNLGPSGHADVYDSIGPYPDDYTHVYRGNWLVEVSPVPVPAAVWLFGSGLLGLVGVARRKA